MTPRQSIFWACILVASQLVIVGEDIAVRFIHVTRPYTGPSAYVAMLSMAALSFLLFSPLFWKSHRWIAVSGSCVAAVSLATSFCSSW
jgi:hypothetical protein